ncbi:MAG: DUF3795 domain-containing protein [Bacteroidota bacterium]
MEAKLAYCGLICDTCPIHLATLEPDEARKLSLREEIAKELFRIYGTKMDPKDINDCDGCRADSGRLFSGEELCEIRKCAREKNLENCAYCSEYACDTLNRHLALDPDSRVRLEEIRDVLKVIEHKKKFK